jgi:two-component system, OmpR family, response regulator ChvI
MARMMSQTASAIRLLFVEDDDCFREVLAAELADRGFDVQSFPDGFSLLSALDARLDADLILLDWKLPRMTGIDLLPRLRRRGVTSPVVFLTGHTPSTYETLAFDRGATDFIDKARGVDVLVRRLRHAVEATNGAAKDQQRDARLVAGQLVLRTVVSRAYWKEIDVGLTVGEYNVIYLLASNQGRYVTYRSLYDKVHYEGFVAGPGALGYRSNVRTFIKRIRRKFLTVDPTFDEIKNYANFGYCWATPNTAPKNRAGDKPDTPGREKGASPAEYGKGPILRRPLAGRLA